MYAVPYTKVEERKRYVYTLARFLDEVFGERAADAILIVRFTDETVMPWEVKEIDELPLSFRARASEAITRTHGMDGSTYFGIYFSEIKAAVVFVRPQQYWRIHAAVTSFHELLHHIQLKGGPCGLYSYVDGLVSRGRLDSVARLVEALTSRGKHSDVHSLMLAVNGLLDQFKTHFSTVCYMLFLMDAYDKILGAMALDVARAIGLDRDIAAFEHTMDSVRKRVSKDKQLRDLVDAAKREVLDALRDPAVQEYTFNFVGRCMRRKPRELRDRYHEIFEGLENYVSTALFAAFG